MENTNKTEVTKAVCKAVVLITSDRLRELANELDRAKAQARKGDSTMIALTDSITLVCEEKQ